MALGGGTFTAQNKVLPGTYVNVISRNSIKNNTESGVVAMPICLDWGPDDKIFEVTADEFEKVALEVFGRSPYDGNLINVREVFKHSTKGLFFKINNNGTKAGCKYADAKCKGSKGNSIKIVIKKNIDQTEKYDVSTYMDTTLVDVQTVASSGELKDNAFIEWKESFELEETADTFLTGGTGGINDKPTNEAHTMFMQLLENYAFNVVAVMETDTKLQEVYKSWTIRMRDEMGIKFQTVMYNCEADYEGIINVMNTKDVIPWVAGAEAACGVNKACTNMLYDGELEEINCQYTQAELENAITSGKFVIHKCGDELRVLRDINSLTTVTEDKGSIFQENQTIRVIDYIADNVASVFNSKYIGKIPNDDAGRNSLRNDIREVFKHLESVRAIEDFSEEDISVERGTERRSVVILTNVTVIGLMDKLYMTTVIN